MTSVEIQVPEAFEPLLAPGKRMRGAWGGRAGAKSWFFAALLIQRALSNPKLRAVCIREVQKSIANSVKTLLEDTIQRLGVGSYFRVLQTRIEFGQGGVIEFEGMQNHTAQSIKSLEGFDIAWVEEAQAISAVSLKLLIPTIRKKGSELWFSWNPQRADDPIEDLLRNPKIGPPENSVVVFVSYKDNPWLSDEIKETIEWDLKRDPEMWAHVWWGEFETNSEARVFKNWKVREFEAPPGAIFYYGGDWGFTEDPTCCVRLFIIGRELYIDYEVLQKGCEIDRTPALFDKLGCVKCSRSIPCDGTAEGHGQARKWVMRADSARPETISYMQKHGYPRMRPAKKGPGSVDDGITFLQAYDIIVHPRCTNTIKELQHYKYKVDPKTNNPIPELEDKNNHIIDSLRYATEELRRSEAKVTVSPVNILKPGPITIGEPSRHNSLRSQGWNK
jgi:phage terminase large subunit